MTEVIQNQPETPNPETSNPPTTEPPLIQRKRGRPRKNPELNPTEPTHISEKSGNRKGWQSTVRQQLNDLWGMIAVGIVFIDATDSDIFATRAPRITEAIIHIAEVKPEFRKFLLRTSEGALYVELLGAIAPIIILICVNHKLLPQFMAIPYGGMPKPFTGADMNGNNDNGNNGPFNISELLSGAMASRGTPDDHRTNGFG